MTIIMKFWFPDSPSLFLDCLRDTLVRSDLTEDRVLDGRRDTLDSPAASTGDIGRSWVEILAREEIDFALRF